ITAMLEFKNSGQTPAFDLKITMLISAGTFPLTVMPPLPEQNGRHERMHLTLKLETTKPAAKNFLQQQAKFDEFIDDYNNERPHQGLNMQYPAEAYVPSTRAYRG